VDKQTYLIILLGGQLTLIGLDLRVRFWGPDKYYETDRLPRSVLFLFVTVMVYGALQFGGLALAPSAQELLVASQGLVREHLAASTERGSMTAPGLVVLGIVSFYFVGLCDYLFHRYASHSRLLWFTHENHHLPTDVSTFMPGMCVRPFAVVVVIPTTAVAIITVQTAVGILGYAASDLMPLLYGVVLAQTSILGISHSCFLRRQWWLHRWLKPLGITTPQEHWLHHTSDLECNYGNFITLWDRVFKTYVDPVTVTTAQHRAGLDYDQDFLGAITAGKLKLPDRLRRYFGVERYCYLDPVLRADSKSV
jgi:sterol desaturase/sphingolipid hydroxylase (fatty acid hydroxylase superfamily)